MLRAVALLVFLVLGSAIAGAQTDQPLMGSGSTTDSTVATQPNDYRILVIGDALGGGLGAGLTRMAEVENGIQVTNRFVEESGIARPEVYDWGETLPKIVEGKGYDAVVVLLGSNDRQMIRAGNFRFGFIGPEWIAAYKAQMDRVLDVLAASGARIYWVSIPPMAEPDYESAMRIIMALQKERVEAKGVTFVDIRQAFLNADGTYTDRGPDDTGEIRKLRSRDGVTFFKQGNNRLGQLVLAAIKQGMTSAPVAVEAPAEAKTNAEASQVPDLPLFGQDDGNGNPVTQRPTDVQVAATQGLQTAAPRDGILADLAAMAVRGSAAEKLFSLGLAPAAPAGRIDDFSAADRSNP